MHARWASILRRVRRRSMIARTATRPSQVKGGELVALVCERSRRHSRTVSRGEPVFERRYPALICRCSSSSHSARNCACGARFRRPPRVLVLRIPYKKPWRVRVADDRRTDFRALTDTPALSIRCSSGRAWQAAAVDGFDWGSKQPTH